MSEQLYDIIITGRLLEGVSQDQAVQRVAQLFKTGPDKAAQLVDGKPHRIKKDLTEDAARKFKSALTKAGLQTVAKPSAASNAAENTASEAASPQTAPTQPSSSLDLAPEGTPVLKEDERKQVIAPDLDLSGIALAEQEPWGGDNKPEPPTVEPPDFGLAPPGADIETLPDTREKLEPDTSSLSLDEPGAILGEPEPAPPPAPDTSHIKLEKHNPFL